MKATCVANIPRKNRETFVVDELCIFYQKIWIKLLDIWWRVVNLDVVVAKSREGVTFL